MKILLFRFEENAINYVDCEIVNKDLSVGKTEKVGLESANSQGERYKMIYDELFQLSNKFTGYTFIYQLPRSGKIVYEKRYANEAILHYFTHTNGINLEVLYRPDIRKKIGMGDKEMKAKEEIEELNVIRTYNIKKTDKLLEGLVFLSLTKSFY